MSAIAWTCEDEEEALGVELIMQRAGVPVRIVEREHGFAVEPDDGFADQAEGLRHGIARHYVRAQARELGKRIDRRDRLGRHAWWGSIALGVLAIVALTW
jgi:hypothetical protein